MACKMVQSHIKLHNHTAFVSLTNLDSLDQHTKSYYGSKRKVKNIAGEKLNF